jgi:hypothetical protein
MAGLIIGITPMISHFALIPVSEVSVNGAQPRPAILVGGTVLGAGLEVSRGAHDRRAVASRPVTAKAIDV